MKSETLKFITKSFAIIALMVASFATEAQQYVFISNETNGYFIDNTAKATQTFTEATCVWTASGTLDNNDRTLVCNGSYLDGANSNSGTVKIGTTRNRYWRGNNNNLCYYRSANRQVYRDGSDVKWNGSTNIFRIYTYTKTDEVFTVAPITGVNDVLTTTGTYNLSSAASYTPEYYKYTGPDTRYYASGVTTGAIVATSAANAGIAAKTSGFTSDTWSITPSVTGVSINNNGRLSYTSQVTNDVQITIKHTVTENGKTKSAEKTILFYAATIATPTITRTGNSVALSTTSLNATIYYTTDGTTPTASSTPYTSPIDLTSLTLPVTIKAIAIRNGNLSSVSSKEYQKLACAQPIISIASNGAVTITAESGTTIYYTTNGDDPTTSSSPYSASFNVTNETTVKAIAVKSNWDNSPVASAQYLVSGVSDGKVILNDYEDHNWTYYAGVDESVDGGNYNESYLGKLYSPDPRNVKITYNATNGAQVSISESETSFVYYKTIEKVDNAYKYQVISNPFSKRPAHSGSTYYGFTGWKIVSGGDYINGYSDGETIPLDAEITFVNLPYPSVNCTSAEIVFETTWGEANRTYITTNPSSNQTYTFNSGTYETNFIVINVNYTRSITISGSATIMMVEPDGGSDYRTKTFSSLIVPATGAANTTKIEWASWAPSGNIDAYGRNFTIGRGVTTSTSQKLYGTNQTAGTSNVVNQVLKIESGSYSSFNHFINSGTNCITKQIVVFGCDYDRAKGDNEKLSITGQLIGANGSGAGNASGTHDANLLMSKAYMKSGTFMTGVTIAGAEWDHSYYLGINNAKNATGKRLFEMEGGYLASNIAGGMDISMDGMKNSDQYINVFIRIRGGHVLGSIYGGARYAESQGSRQIVLTGGEVNGWIAGGANGNEETQGGTEGASYIYVGGNAKVDSKDDGTSIGSSIGGCIYGAGCGYGPESSSGEMGLGTNVVVADNAYVERGVYGGGAFGYCATDQTANVYITGGHIEGKSGDYTDRDGFTTNGIIGGVFGGARMRYGGSANIYMTGGWVETGVYGGSNYTGTLEGNVKMVITGGKVGTDATHTANVHGGGYGQPTRVTGNVDVTLGTITSGVTAGSAVVYGDVYGGSALGYVNGTTTSTSKHTNVTLNGGDVYGAVYGGGLGDGSNAANVYAPVTVTINGGSATNVFGCNNTNGRPMSTVNVNMTGGLVRECVYGGGNAAGYTGTPHVAISGGEVDKHVFGGGLGANAVVTGDTDVKVTEAEGATTLIKGNVYGGGNAAAVTGNTKVTIGE